MRSYRDLMANVGSKAFFPQFRPTGARKPVDEIRQRVLRINPADPASHDREIDSILDMLCTSRISKECR